MIPFSGAYEGKIADMDADARKAFCEENKASSAFEKIITQGYKVLQLMYFFTAGHDEVKAWSIQVRNIIIGFQNCRCSIICYCICTERNQSPTGGRSNPYGFRKRLYHGRSFQIQRFEGGGQ